MPLTALEKYAKRLELADSIAGNTVLEQRKAFSAPDRGIRLANPDTASQLAGSIAHFAGMELLEALHQEVNAKKKKDWKQIQDIHDSKWDNSPYRKA